MSLFRDEQDGVSSARVLCWSWTAYLMVFLWRHWAEVPQHVLAGMVTIELGFVTWAAGPRAAQYLAPAVKSAAERILAVWKRRDPADGVEPTP